MQTNNEKDVKNSPKIRLRSILYEIGIIIAGSFLFAMSLNMFLRPGNIILGGATGVSTTLNILFNSPIGVVIILINIPLIIANTWVYGIRFLGKTIVGIVTTSVAIDIITFFPITITDPLLCGIFGGVTMGAGTGLLFTRGYTTGGSDLLAWLLRKKYKSLSTGRLMLIIDFIIIFGSALALKNYETIIYSIISIYAFSFVLDLVLSGTDRAKLALIISSQYTEIADAIQRELERGVTVLFGKGWYTRDNKDVLMCVVKKEELYDLKRLVHGYDSNAFIILSNASEVLGYGFKSENH
ncbi:MAG: YitT family protein [Clostridiales bacterium]|nr:YitT family protein [Clostridiales bacterium]